MRSALFVVVIAAASLVAACGDDDNTDERTATVETQSERQPLPDSSKTTETPDTDEAAAEECGSIDGGPGGGDAVENITAEGTNCETAQAVARAVTIEGADTAPRGFDCPDANTY